MTAPVEDWELALHGSVEARDTYEAVQAVARAQEMVCFVCYGDLDNGQRPTLFSRPDDPSVGWVLCEDCSEEYGDGDTGGHEAIILIDLERRLEV